MYTFKAFVIPIIAGLFIASLFGRWGHSKHIGFSWAFLFGLVSPVIALPLLLLCKGKRKAPAKNRFIVTIVGIILAIYGSIMIIGTFNPDQDNTYAAQKIRTVKVDHQNPEVTNTAMYGNMGRVIVAGLPALTVDFYVFLARDYRWMTFSKLYAGLLSMLVAIYLLKPSKKVIVQPCKGSVAARKREAVVEKAEA